MKDNNIYIAVLAASLFGVSIPVFAESMPAANNAEAVSADDGALAAKVKMALAGDGSLASLPLSVEVQSGVVLLGGSAVEKDRQRVEEVVLGIAGVKEVKNLIRVQ